MQLKPHIDWLLFTKRGYSLLKHVVPFSIAAVLLVLVSVPKDNLLVQLASRLQQASWLWLPAGLLTLATIAVYLATVSVQIRSAYLFKEGLWRRTIATSILYIVICTSMAYGVLRSTSSASLTAGMIWACLLLALLSLTGIGWSGPSSWVESIGIQCPDYTESDEAALSVTIILNRLRREASSKKSDVDEFLESVNNLRTGIEKNIKYEPTWAQAQIASIVDKLKTLQHVVKSSFPDSNEHAIQDFAVACRCQKSAQYSEFITALTETAQNWTAWKCS
jgi:hypothetical protein